MFFSLDLPIGYDEDTLRWTTCAITFQTVDNELFVIFKYLPDDFLEIFDEWFIEPETIKLIQETCKKVGVDCANREKYMLHSFLALEFASLVSFPFKFALYEIIAKKKLY